MKIYSPKKLATAAILTAMLTLGSTEVQSAKSEEQIIRHAPPQFIEAFLAALDPNYRAILEHHLYSFKLQDHNMVLSILDHSLQLKYEVTRKDLTLTRINDWNRKKAQFSRAYISTEGSAALETRIELSKGITYESFVLFFSSFLAECNWFDTHLN